MRVRTPRLRARVLVSALALAVVSALASRPASASVDCLGPSCGGSNSIMSGNVGIGTTSAVGKLNADATSGNILNLTNNGTSEFSVNSSGVATFA